jgi:hypothetical protein
MRDWNGVVIAESLRDPMWINGFPVYRAYVSPDALDLGPGRPPGRWHLYWVRASWADIDGIRSELLEPWYAHFWNEKRLIVVYADARFEMDRFDQATWRPAVEHGLSKGIPEEQLDFPTDDSTGTLE